MEPDFKGQGSTLAAMTAQRFDAMLAAGAVTSLKEAFTDIRTDKTCCTRD